MPLTPTARLGLFQADPDPVTGDNVDVTKINDNFDKLDEAVGASPVTSGTRPTGTDRWDGRLIRETDTRRWRGWNETEDEWEPLGGAEPVVSSSRPADPYDGQFIRETDTRLVRLWNNNQGVWEHAGGAIPCTSSTRPASPRDGLLIRESDTRRVLAYNSAQSQWDYVGDVLTICTSGTRPASPYSGQLIRETDTRRVYVRTPAGAWERIADPDAEVRTLDALRVTTSGSFQTTSTDPSEVTKLRSASISVVNGDSYRFHGQTLYTASDPWSLEIRKGSTGGTQVGTIRMHAGSDAMQATWDVVWPCTADETTQFYYVANRLTGSGSIILYADQGGLHTFASIERIGKGSIVRDVP